FLQTPEMFLRGPKCPPFAAIRQIREKCRMDDALPLQAHKKTVIVFLQLVNAGDAASLSGSKTNHKSVFLSRVFCSAYSALVPRHFAAAAFCVRWELKCLAQRPSPGFA